MTKVFLDPSLRSKLHNLSEPLEFCDETGRVVGRFLPSPEIILGSPSGPSASEEELERREKEPDFSTAEVLAYLETL
jgi:hypothetical protein